ncbi:carcinoembryonic antigen-related cell adhesion molecule 1-like [Pseudorasbora parva]|uniref:carcinoembryonic antigen-related cell adhesion molecule 1-like n=1 Tax=Pseudorasbora parva TaxID=51549 RepID=UPI00351EF361
MRLHLISSLLFLYFLDHGSSGVGADEVSVSVMEGDSVTLHTGVQTNQQDRIRWYYNDIRIAQINRDQSKVCTDVQCNEDTERFRDRLKLDHQTGSLTITHTTTEDSGDYYLKIFSSSDSAKIFSVSVHGVFSVGPDGESVSVMEGDSVTLHTGVQTNQQDRIKWYCNDTLIAQINRVQCKVCTDVQCNEGTERFRDRLKLDHQTGSLTITNTTTEDSGEYTLKIINSSDSETIFSVSVRGVSAADRDEVKRKSVKEGESVTLDPAVMKNTNYLMAWYFTDVLIAKITGDQSQICADDQCKERFRDRLKLDHQTGSLNITRTRTEDSGEYNLQITYSRISIIRSFSVSVTAIPGSGLSAGGVAGIIIAVLVVFGAAVRASAVIYYYRYRSNRNGKYYI